MGSSGVQMVCVALGVLGLIGTIVCCAIPQWKVSAFVGQNIVTAQTHEEGLWMSCVVQSTGQQQCKVYDSIMNLSTGLQAARAMTIISCMVTSLAILILFAGSDFTTCVENEDAKPKISLAAGISLLVGGLLLLIPVSWDANTTISNFYNTLVPQKMELGACIFVGWAASAVLILAGGLLMCFSKRGSSGGVAKYRSNAPPTNKNYV
ncbi:claudin i [Esox lucius]|uniref:Claudin n=1 Tax=Esox lucius TaxID=8010 RepID=A0AAY5L2K3_ESOLU|nr:claudin i [Esox lucius]